MQSQVAKVAVATGSTVLSLLVYIFLLDGITADGTSSNTGHLGGLFALLAKELPHIVALVCCGHSANLAMKAILEENDQAKEVISNE